MPHVPSNAEHCSIDCTVVPGMLSRIARNGWPTFLRAQMTRDVVGDRALRRREIEIEPSRQFLLRQVFADVHRRRRDFAAFVGRRSALSARRVALGISEDAFAETDAGRSTPDVVPLALQALRSAGGQRPALRNRD